MPKLSPFCLLLPLLLFSTAPAHPDQDLIPFHPQLIRQIDAVLEYYRLHGAADPLCRGERAERRTRALNKLKSLLLRRKNSAELSKKRLSETFSLLPFAPDPTIRLTRYAVFTVPGKTAAQKGFDSPLLDLPPEEGHLNEGEAELRRQELLRFRLTKQDILGGALPAEQFRPLAWLSRAAFEEALLQGSVRVEFEDGTRFHYNVSRSNDIPYKRGLPGEKQQRYWFFKRVFGPLGYGMWSEWQLPIFPMAALAGDIGRLGLGAVIFLDSPRGRILAILADTGGAFVDNTTQLDLFLGTLDSRKEYHRLNRSLPQGGKAFILE